MKPLGFKLAVLLFPLLLWGCAAWNKPRLDRNEKEILKFHFSGVGIGTPPGDLKRFAQVQKIPGPEEGIDIYQVFNPNPHISMAVLWFRNERTEKIELRYIDGPVVNTLTVSGGWQGILDYMIKRYGPPSDSGPNVPIAASVGGLDPATALFNGEWIFSRVYRQLNYIATTNPQGSLAIVTLQETPDPAAAKKKSKNGARPEPTPIPVSPNPGF